MHDVVTVVAGRYTCSRHCSVRAVWHWDWSFAMACSGNQGHRELVAGVVLLEAFLMRRMACSLDPIAGYGYGGAHLQEVFEGGWW